VTPTDDESGQCNSAFCVSQKHVKLGPTERFEANTTLLVAHSLLVSSTLKMEAVHISETSADCRATRRYNADTTVRI
jgi:hypothetical protein